MVHIKTHKGLDIPIEGKPTGSPQFIVPSGQASSTINPELIALDLTSFEDLKFRLLIDLGEEVKRGQPLVEDKECLGRYFVSPAGGVIHEIRRGLKRRLLYIVIKVSEKEKIEKMNPINFSHSSREELIEILKKGGLFTRITQRPFGFLANPSKTPKAVFVKAIESAPFTPPPELFIQQYAEEFQIGLDVLSKLTNGLVHLVYSQNSDFKPFLEATNVVKHTAEGPHPISSQSLHIEEIEPIQSVDTVIWTLTAQTVTEIGYYIKHGENLFSKIISIAGPGIIEGKTGYFKVREGFPISALVAGRIHKGLMRLLSGDPLTGHSVSVEDFLGYNETVFCVIPENRKREFLHFFRLGDDKFSASAAYLSGHLNNENREYAFTTNQHGEKRAFIDNTLYDDVMPINISTIHLVKAILAEDYELADKLGLLSVVSEDFALPAFVCPSKIEMPEIVKKGLKYYAADMLK